MQLIIVKNQNCHIEKYGVYKKTLRENEEREGEKERETISTILYFQRRLTLNQVIVMRPYW